MGWGNLNIFSSTTGVILTRLGTNHPWIEEIQMSLKEGLNPLQGGNNSEVVKYKEVSF
jgi:hypothetical protein